MDGNELYHLPDLVRFYDPLYGGARADFDFCMRLAKNASSVLDLGCGTGQLTVAMADGGRRAVFGLDPAGPMLDVARARPGGERVTWVCEDARSVRLGRRFELIVMTGHAFQVFLTREDRLAALQTFAAHLSPGGRFVFDTRNPACREWEEWTPERSRESLHHTRLGAVTVWNDVECDAETGIVTYDTHYEVAAEGRTYSARSRIAFPSKAEVAELIGEAGLRVEGWLGDWDGSPWHENAREIIALGGTA
jgi:SAM-dependent methyltransferase